MYLQPATTQVQSKMQPSSDVDVGMSTVCIILTSTAVFSCINFISSWSVPVPAATSISQAMRWRGSVASLLHAIIVGTACLFTVYVEPSLMDDLATRYCDLALFVIKISAGYFIYDSCYTLLVCYGNGRLDRDSLVLIFHHVLALVYFAISLSTYLLVAYGMMTMTLEINSIFLHVRELLKIAGVPKTSPAYRVNSYVNVGTFIVFRFILHFWLIVMALLRPDVLQRPVFIYGVGILVFLFLISVSLFRRIIISDFIRANDNGKYSAINNNHSLTNNGHANGSATIERYFD